jgi:hypothetical protein
MIACFQYPDRYFFRAARLFLQPGKRIWWKTLTDRITRREEKGTLAPRVHTFTSLNGIRSVSVQARVILHYMRDIVFRSSGTIYQEQQVEDEYQDVHGFSEGGEGERGETSGYRGDTYFIPP